MHAWAEAFVRESTKPTQHYEAALAMAKDATRFLTAADADPGTPRKRRRVRDFKAADPAETPETSRKRRRRGGRGEALRSEMANFGLCHFCDQGNANIQCSGPCHRSFHFDCLGIVTDPGPAFQCDRCSTGVSICALCNVGAAYVLLCVRRGLRAAAAAHVQGAVTP